MPLNISSYKFPLDKDTDPSLNLSPLNCYLLDLLLKKKQLLIDVSSIQLSSTHSDVLVSGGDVGNDGPWLVKDV